jgi:hypothetical protein
VVYWLRKPHLVYELVLGNTCNRNKAILGLRDYADDIDKQTTESLVQV